MARNPLSLAIRVALLGGAFGGLTACKVPEAIRLGTVEVHCGYPVPVQPEADGDSCPKPKKEPAHASDR